MVERKYNFKIEKINWSKVAKTVRGSLKKAIFYLDANVPYLETEKLISVQNDSLTEDNLKEKLSEMYDLFILDAKIRYCDDILDNVLSKEIPKPIKEMQEVIFELKNDLKEDVGDVTNLFLKEIEITENKFEREILEEKIKYLIKIRPCDYFLLIEKIIVKFGSSLSKKDYQSSLEFLKEFQRLRDLLDDIMSIEEDILKGDYNHIVIAHKNNISYTFFDTIVKEKLANLKKIVLKIVQHPNKDLLFETINFWEKEYRSLFKPLLTSYYINIDEFKKVYFMIKQL